MSSPQIKFFAKRYVLVSLCIFLSVNATQAQSTAGKEFWFGFMENFTFTQDSLWVYICSDRNTSGTLEIPLAGFLQNFSVNANSYVKFYIPNYIGMNDTSEQIEYKGIHIISADTILVSCLNQHDADTDGSSVIPKAMLGNEYSALSYKFNSFSWSEFLIVSADSNTILQIIPADTTAAGLLPQTLSVVLLQSGESYQVQSHGDLTGSTVSANKPFAFFSGHQITSVPNECCEDHLFEQMLPAGKWATMYITTPLKSRSYGDTYRILAKEDSTNIYLNGVLIHSLNQNQFSEDTITNNPFSSITLPAVLTSNKQFAVGQYANGTNYDLTDSDPFLLQLWPFSLAYNKTVFQTHPSQNSNPFNYYVNIVAKNTAVTSVKFNGSFLSSSLFVNVNGSDYSYASLIIPYGTHVIESDSAFLAYHYAFVYTESYGYTLTGYKYDTPTSTNQLSNKQFEINIYPNPFKEFATVQLPYSPVNTKGFTFSLFDVSGKKVYCHDEIHTVKFEINRENLGNGVYFYMLGDEKNNTLAKGKVVAY